MTLEDLNKLSSQAEKLLRDGQKYEQAEKLLAALRTHDATLTDEIMNTLRYWTSGNQEVAKTELFAILNTMAPDILRIAEMRLAASSRQAKVSAAAKRNIVASYFGESP